jgi:hypothetical protein
MPTAIGTELTNKIQEPITARPEISVAINPRGLRHTRTIASLTKLPCLTILPNSRTSGINKRSSGHHTLAINASAFGKRHPINNNSSSMLLPSHVGSTRFWHRKWVRRPLCSDLVSWRVSTFLFQSTSRMRLSRFNPSRPDLLNHARTRLCICHLRKYIAMPVLPIEDSHVDHIEAGSTWFALSVWHLCDPVGPIAQSRWRYSCPQVHESIPYLIPCAIGLLYRQISSFLNRIAVNVYSSRQARRPLTLQ